jgi:hypothetical protein
MADLIAWEFLQVVERSEQSEAFQAVNVARPIFYLQCAPPKWFPYMLALHSFGQNVKDVSDDLQKRIFGDKEKTPQLVGDVQELIASRLEFERHFRTLCELTGNLDHFNEYLKACGEVWQEIRRKHKEK